MIILGLLMYMMGLFSLVSNRKYLLLLLISMEMMMLGLFLLFVMCMMGMVNMMSVMIYMVYVVCEASMGLGIMVMMVNFFGSDYMSGFDFLVC
uniref:NADH dehydrogenase subunit 4L n=1 Tax=Paraschizogynium plumachela TaxID=3109024 RepID=UPI002E792B96|nr:NADH dehydrogenase subunit 4L [Paraschizogynium plumachela]WQM21759.1 NADH dehydrogenase subunit 4L [Paraschizogynium plumachela]